jgi:DNA repair exonuclease SbcCD ATPase subunit
MPELDDVKPVEKKGFISQPYSNAERIKRDEEELEELLEAQRNQQSVDDEDDDEAPANAEEKTFKKRYGDLRRHSQKMQEDYQKQISELKSQIKETAKQEFKLPKSEKELEQWMKTYPDVAAIVETIAIKKAKEQAADLEERMSAIDSMRVDAERQKAEALLLQLHPDFDTIRSSDDFHEWAEEQPKWIQQALYENDNDAKAAARAIDLYKADRNIKSQQKSKGNAAEAVGSKGRGRPQTNISNGKVRESDVQKMSTKEYEKNVETIMDAIRTGNFIYDISGSAR